MVGTNNFLIFDQNKLNIVDDNAYQQSTYRQNGAVTGVAPSTIHNKMYYQSSIMASAIGQVFANKGYNVSDSDFNDLVLVLSNMVTKSEIASNWQSSKAYNVGEVIHSVSISNSMKFFECTVAGTSGTTEPTWGAAGTTIVDGTASWKVCDIRQGASIGKIPALVDVGGGKAGLPAVSGKLLTDISGMPIGSVVPFLATKAQPGWLAVDAGAIVSRATYPELWAWVQTDGPLITEAAWQAQAAAQSSVGYYSSGDGSTTFRLPRLLDYQRGGVAADVGKWQGDAIRNITGTIGGNLPPTGVFSIKTTSASLGAGTQGNNYEFDASTQVPTADENRPKTIKVLYCVKAFDAPTNQGMIDITRLGNDVAGKQNTLQYIQMQDEKPSGTAGGTFTLGAWRTRTFNTIKNNDNNIATLINNQITLPAGTYIVDASAPAEGTDLHQIRLQNVSDNTTIATGSSENTSTTNSTDGVQTRSFLSGKFTLPNTKIIELQHYANATFATYGFGQPTNFNTEIYSIIKFWKVG